MALFIGVFTGSASGSSPKPARGPSAVDRKSAEFRLERAAAHINKFATVGEVLTELRKLEVLGHEEHAGIVQILKSRKIPQTAPLVKAKITAERIRWGMASLSVKDTHVLVAGHGQVVRIQKSDPLDKVFRVAFDALSSKTGASRAIDFILPSAVAAESDLLERMSAALTAVAYEARVSIDTFVNSVCGVTTNVSAFLTEVFLEGMAELQSDSIVCHNGRFAFHFGYYKFIWKERYEDILAAELKATGSKSASPTVTSSAACKTGLEWLETALKAETREPIIVKPELLKKAWPHGTPPACTDQTREQLRGVVQREKNKISNTLVSARSMYGEHDNLSPKERERQLKELKQRFFMDDLSASH